MCEGKGEGGIMTRIMRKEIIEYEVEIPEGHEICFKCEGKGMLSKYDEGVRSFSFSEELALLRKCSSCEGLGYIPLIKVRHGD